MAQQTEKVIQPLIVPLLPLRDIIVFPHMVVPLFVGREKSIKALEEALNSKKDIFLVAQKRAKTNNPSNEDLYDIGTLAAIIQMLRLPDGTVKVLIEGKKRARIVRFLPESQFMQVEAEDIEEFYEPSVETEALLRSVKTTFENYVKLNKRIPPEILMSVAGVEEPAHLGDTIAAHLNLKLDQKQKILEVSNPSERLEQLYVLMESEIEMLQIERKIRNRVRKQMEKSQKEYYLNEQMQAIQKELGERDEFKSEILEIEKALKEKKMSVEATKKIKRELRKLKMMSPMSAEATVVRNYIDWVIALPWDKVSEDKIDIQTAEKILDEDHYGLKKIKERILEFLSVRTLVDKMKGPILCLVGPPGVGKTSLARSVGRSMGRQFVRASLGGVRDEAEIRGHRRTYIGALPGKIIQSLRKAGTNNPVFLLDEIDKMSADFRGDPASALLEVLDPEQNFSFNDHYLELDYDLSQVMFITTANSFYNIPRPLLDRMEVIELSGYTVDEKLAIAKQFLIPKQKKLHGLENENVTLADLAILSIINHYTKEAGVRNLEREIATVFRKVAKKFAKEKKRGGRVHCTAKNIHTFLGVPRFRYTRTEEQSEIGLSNGLAWTEVGGDLLTIEATVMPGKGKLTVTGKLGEVMQESARAALSYVRSRAEQLGLMDKEFYQKIDIHIHVPEGAIPKDGPSAGITMATAIVSALIKRPVRNDVAMTGEITLRGRVLPIGGLTEKILAAHRGGIKTVLIPKDNQKDIKELPKNVLKAITVKCMEHMDDVLKEVIILPEGEALFSQPKATILPRPTGPRPIVENVSLSH